MSESKVRRAFVLLLLVIALVLPAVLSQAASFRTETRVFNGSTWVAKAILDFASAGYGIIAGEYQGAPKPPAPTTCALQVFFVKGMAHLGEEVTQFGEAVGLEVDLQMPENADLYATTKDAKGGVAWVKIWEGGKGPLKLPSGYKVDLIGRTDDGWNRFQVRAWPAGDPCFAF